jgi:hypothetical protein
LKYIFRIFLFLIPTILFAQEVTLFQQFNGRFDYLSFGNTLNIGENGGTTDCTILSESSADFQLQTGQQVVAAYLYWAGSGDKDLEVSLNGNPVIAEREFNRTPIKKESGKTTFDSETYQKRSYWKSFCHSR